MIVKINFSAPFRGVAYSDYDRSSPCKFYGDGSKYFEMRLPLKGCGTKQVTIMFIDKHFSFPNTIAFYFTFFKTRTRVINDGQDGDEGDDNGFRHVTACTMYFHS